MLSPDAASLTIAVAAGLVKLGERADVLFAEKEATTAALAIPMPTVRFPEFSRATKVEKLQSYLDATVGQNPDPLRPDRKAIADLVAKAEDVNAIDAAFECVFPGTPTAQDIDPEGEFLKTLRARFPTLDLMDEDTRVACFCCAAGADSRELGYPARIALLVADVLAEFAAENTGLIVHDEGARKIVQSVLEQFAKPQLEDYTAWSPLLRHTLGATVDGLLANRDTLASAKPWLDGILAALAMARDQADGGENFVTGLVRGKGYRVLLANGLLVAGERLGAANASPYQQIAADVLRAAAPLAAEGSESFNDFFQDNWGDLLRAGLTSTERYGPKLLQGDKPVVREATLALLDQLARTPDASLFSGETLYGIANAVIATVATRPELLDPSVREAWVKDLIGSLARTASDTGLQQSLTREGLRDAFRTAAGVLGRHPELLSEQPAQRVEMIGAVLQSVSAAGAVDTRTLATGAIAAVLTRIGEQPQLLDTPYAAVLSTFAGEVARLVASGTLTRAQATDLIDAAAEAVQRNPDLFAKLEGRVATAVMNGVLQGSRNSQLKLLGGTVLVDTLAETLRVVALRGRDLVETTTEKALVAKVADTVSAGLVRSNQELGRGIDVTYLPFELAGLVGAVARGDVTTVDVADPKFQEVFGFLTQAASAAVIAREGRA